MQTWLQARAHALLKAKEGELRTAREDAQAEHANELAATQRQLAEASKELSQVRSKASHVTALPLLNLCLSILYCLSGSDIGWYCCQCHTQMTYDSGIGG